jgi:hypothetical protein
VKISVLPEEKFGLDFAWNLFFIGPPLYVLWAVVSHMTKAAATFCIGILTSYFQHCFVTMIHSYITIFH